jgi:hypothetical protein
MRIEWEIPLLGIQAEPRLKKSPLAGNHGSAPSLRQLGLSSFGSFPYTVERSAMIGTFLHLALWAYRDTSCTAISLWHARSAPRWYPEGQNAMWIHQIRPQIHVHRINSCNTPTLLLLDRALNLLDNMPLLLLPTHSPPLTLLQLFQMRIALRTRLRKPKLAHFAVPIRRLGHRVRDVPVLGDKVRDGAVCDEHDVGVGAREGEDVVACRRICRSVGRGGLGTSCAAVMWITNVAVPTFFHFAEINLRGIETQFLALEHFSYYTL